MREKLFSFGGCAYRMQVDARHATSLAHLAATSVLSSYHDDGAPHRRLLAGTDYRHTSDLPRGRCLWLRDQIAEPRFAWAVSCDSDTTFDAAHLLGELARVTGQIAIGLAPVRIGGTERCNLRLRGPQPPDERQATTKALAAVLDGDRLIESGGFGLAVFNLAWFRTSWPLPTPEGLDFETSEDIAFCRAVASRGGLIAALRVRTDHYAFGESQIR